MNNQKCEIITLFEKQLYIPIIILNDYILFIEEGGRLCFPEFSNISKQDFELNFAIQMYNFINMQPKLYKAEVISEFNTYSVNYNLLRQEKNSDIIKYILIKTNEKVASAYLEFLEDPKYEKSKYIKMINIDSLFETDIDIKDSNFDKYIKSKIYIEINKKRYSI